MDYFFETNTTSNVIDGILPKPQGNGHQSTANIPSYSAPSKFDNHHSTTTVPCETQIGTHTMKDQTLTNWLDEFSIQCTYVYDFIQERISYVNRRFEEVLGYKIGELSQYTIIELVHPKDQEKLKKHICALIGMGVKEFREIELRIRAKNGKWVWCKSRDAIAEIDSSKKPIRFIGNFVDISDQMERQKRMMKRDKEMENFVYTAAHDLKSPLNSVQQILDISLKDLGEKKELNKVEYMLEMANNSVGRLKELVDSLLSNALIERKQELEKVDLTHIIENLKIDLKASIKESGAIIKHNFTGNINVYQVQFRLLLQNLLTNAIKFKQLGIHPEIELSVKEQQDQYVFKIKDNGIGIPKDKINKIFKFFYKVHGPSVYSGSGIGLASCKKIIEMHEGKIWAESEIGQGTSMFFTIKKLSE